MSEQHQLYINGAWIETEASVVNTSPSDTTDVIGHYAQASMPQVEAAITAANAAVLEWGSSALETRYSVLMDIGNRTDRAQWRAG
ncbi:MAG: aldehyde dehydrogenase family protein [Luminiphilus sp.]